MQRGDSERRRKGIVNRLRRSLYGLLLACGAPLACGISARAVASDTQSVAPEAESQQNFAALVFIKGLAEDQARPVAFGASFSRAAIGEISEQSLSATPLPLRNGLLTLSFSDDELRRWRKGAGLDITVPDLGQFRLNFFSRGGEALKRWDLSPVTEELESESRPWSLGASVDWVRTREGEGRELVFIPKLAVDVSDLLKTRTRLDVCIQYAHWRSREPGEHQGRVPQAVLRWAF